MVNKKYFLRTSPEIIKRIESKLDDDQEGNIAHICTTGEQGIAYASQTDSTGRVWWFVCIKNMNTNPKTEFPEKGSYYLGWMSSRYVKKE